MKHQYFYEPPGNANRHLQWILHLPFLRALIKNCVLLQKCLSLQSATFYKSYCMCAVFCAYPSTGHALLQGMPFFRAWCPVWTNCSIWHLESSTVKIWYLTVTKSCSPFGNDKLQYTDLINHHIYMWRFENLESSTVKIWYLTVTKSCNPFENDKIQYTDLVNHHILQNDMKTTLYAKIWKSRIINCEDLISCSNQKLQSFWEW